MRGGIEKSIKENIKHKRQSRGLSTDVRRETIFYQFEIQLLTNTERKRADHVFTDVRVGEPKSGTSWRRKNF